MKSRRQFYTMGGLAPEAKSTPANSLISVVLPVYNHAQFLPEAITSILEASSEAAELEVIVVDDGSSEPLDEAMRAFSEVEQVRLIRQDHSGLPAALNRGFNEARGSLLTWTSADNRYHPHALQRMSRFLMANPLTDLVYANMNLIGHTGDPYVAGEYRPQDISISSPSVVCSPLDSRLLGWRDDNFIGACFLFRRRVLDLIGDHKLELMGVEDFDYWLRTNEVFTLNHIDTDEPLYDYRIHESSITASLGASSIQSHAKELVKSHRATRKSSALPVPVRQQQLEDSRVSEMVELSTPAHASFLAAEMLAAHWLPSSYSVSNGLLLASPLEFPTELRAARYSNFQAVVPSAGTKAVLGSFVPATSCIEQKEYWKGTLSRILNSSGFTLALLCHNRLERTLAEELFLSCEGREGLRIIDLSEQIDDNGQHSEDSINSLCFALSSIDGLLFAKSPRLNISTLLELYLECLLAAHAGVFVHALLEEIPGIGTEQVRFSPDQRSLNVFDLWSRLLPISNLQIVRSAQDNYLTLLENQFFPDQRSLEQQILEANSEIFSQRVQQVAVAKTHCAS